MAIAIFLLTLWSCVVLSPQDHSNDQVVTRMALAVSIVDSGSLMIDRFSSWTGDKALFDGHVYADKVPGHPFLAVSLVAADKWLRQRRGLSTDARQPEVFFDYVEWGTLGINCVFAALAAAVLFLTALRLGATPSAAVFASFATSLATPFFGWSTAFFAHSLTGSLLLLGVALAVWMQPTDGAPRRMPILAGAGLLLGLLLGYDCGVDLTAAPAAAIIGVFALAGARRGGQLPGTVLVIAVGGVVGLLPLAIYNQLAFGSPFHLGYSNTDFAGMEQGLFGVTWPSPVVLAQVLFGVYRGILPLSPILLLVPVGLVAMFRRGGLKGPALVVVLVVLAYLWINASYYYWNGGWSTGPRHLVAALPVAGVALAFAWPARTGERLLVSLLLASSLTMSLASALAGMFAPEKILNELTGWILPRILDPSVDLPGLYVLPAWAMFALLLVVAERRLPTSTVAPASRLSPVP